MQQDKRKNDPGSGRDQGPNQSQERNLRDLANRDFDTENVPDPISFGDEDLDRVEQIEPKADDQDDIKDSR